MRSKCKLLTLKSKKELCAIPFDRMMIDFIVLSGLIISLKNDWLDFDWLRAVQLECNTSAKSVTPLQITMISEVGHPTGGVGGGGGGG